MFPKINQFGVPAFVDYSQGLPVQPSILSYPNQIQNGMMYPMSHDQQQALFSQLGQKMMGYHPFDISQLNYVVSDLMQMYYATLNPQQRANPWVQASVSSMARRDMVTMANIVRFPLVRGQDFRDFLTSDYVECNTCGGTGRRWFSTCDRCNGYGVVLVQGDRVFPMYRSY